MSKDNFKTKHKLKFQVANMPAPFPGFAPFVLGGVAGFFSIPQADMSVDVIFGEIAVGEHIEDAVEWFAETAREINAIGVRVIGCKDRELRSFLIQKFGFNAARDGMLIKPTTLNTAS